MQAPTSAATFTGSVDLACETVGGRALFATDEFFAPKENLLKPAPAIFEPDRYTEFGKWMDGWESRRKRVAGHDHCIVRLGLPGVVHGVDIDTSHFLGNHPPYASLEGAAFGAEQEVSSESGEWEGLLPRVPLAPGSHNLFPVLNTGRWTHVRLNIYPDGGVARLRVFGTVVPDWSAVPRGSEVDLACVANGGVVVAASDMFFGSKENLILPYPSASMRDGWESRRRRGPGHDWAIVQLGRSGQVKRLEIDTRHFKGNYPDQCSVESCYAPHAVIDALNAPQFDWKDLLPRTKLEAHRVQEFARELRSEHARASHVRLNIYPDGGVSRLRVHGIPE